MYAKESHVIVPSVGSTSTIVWVGITLIFSTFQGIGFKPSSPKRTFLEGMLLDEILSRYHQTTILCWRHTWKLHVRTAALSWSQHLIHYYRIHKSCQYKVFQLWCDTFCNIVSLTSYSQVTLARESSPSSRTNFRAADPPSSSLASTSCAVFSRRSHGINHHLGWRMKREPV